jgi:flagellin
LGHRKNHGIGRGGLQGHFRQPVARPSTIAVARSGAEQITKLLVDIKGKIVASQEENVDRGKIQADITALTKQIESIAGAAQFNGLNMLSNQSRTAGTGTVSVLSSLDRSADGSVNASTIKAGKQDLGIQASIVGTGAAFEPGSLNGLTGTATTIAVDATSALINVVGDTARAGGAIMAGDTYSIGGLAGTVNFVAREGDTQTDIAKGLVARINFEATKSNTAITAQYNGSTGFTITNKTAAALAVTAALTTGGTVGGGLAMLDKFDVTTSDGAKAALGAIEGLTQTAISAAASFGTAQKRIEVQQSFDGSLMDSMKSGIGSMVDANMEEASARLQALQVQQQLATQSLSIANHAPQRILSLFR